MSNDNVIEFPSSSSERRSTAAADFGIVEGPFELEAVVPDREINPNAITYLREAHWPVREMMISTAQCSYFVMPYCTSRSSSCSEGRPHFRPSRGPGPEAA
jgi:hypothetical protein